jgi:hypothetical protein
MKRVHRDTLFPSIRFHSCMSARIAAKYMPDEHALRSARLAVCLAVFAHAHAGKSGESPLRYPRLQDTVFQGQACG